MKIFKIILKLKVDLLSVFRKSIEATEQQIRKIEGQNLSLQSNRTVFSNNEKLLRSYWYWSVQTRPWDRLLLPKFRHPFDELRSVRLHGTQSRHSTNNPRTKWRPGIDLKGSFWSFIGFWNGAQQYADRTDPSFKRSSHLCPFGRSFQNSREGMKKMHVKLWKKLMQMKVKNIFSCFSFWKNFKLFIKLFLVASVLW